MDAKSKAKQRQLDRIKAEIVQNNICPDLAKTAKHLVFGEGQPNADIVFIGEAPGKNEDLHGRPFIGAAGKLLDELLAGIGLERADVYITSILKYRPPGNRDPKPDEKKAFLPYLQAQLEVIEPKLVVTLGRHSLNCFVPEAQITKLHGQARRLKLQLKGSSDTLTIVLLPLFHPAAALYTNSLRQILIDDFAYIPKIIKQSTNLSSNDSK